MPAWPLTIFFTGQPKLMSMMAAPRSWLSRAASAIDAGSQPASWTAMGNSSAQLVAIFMVWRDARIMAWLAIISETTSPAPLRLTSRRNGMSLTPDMGARITGSSILIGPMFMPMFWAIPCIAVILCKLSWDSKIPQVRRMLMKLSIRAEHAPDTLILTILS